jgi:hypothetical protein
MSMNLHDEDFFAWTQKQAELFRAGQIEQLDFENIIEEIESMGASERRELGNRLAVLLSHMLKWRHQPERQCKSWLLTIKEQRQRSCRVLRNNPSLKSKLDETFADAYQDARLMAARETGLDENEFPKEAPWTPLEALED